MLQFQSPWLFELKRQRKVFDFTPQTNKNDIIIVGGGIAGVITAYYLLTLTKKKMLLVEQNMIASGATGHNAGQVVTYFEKPTEEIIQEYGETLAIEGQTAVNQAWDLLHEIQKDIRLKTPLHIFEGLSGCVTFKAVEEHFKNRYYRPQISHQKEFCFVADDCPFLKRIPEIYADLYTIVPRKVILDLLETRDSNYSVAFTSKKGCMNSASFSEEVITYLVKKYPERIKVFENTKVSEIILNQHDAEVILDKKQKLTAGKIVLCTNGFKHIKIVNRDGKTINAEYHELVRGKKGFMKAYTFKDDKKPTAVSYYNTNNKPYFYLTRRPSTFSKDNNHNLIAVGGPEYFLADKTTYNQESEFPAEVLKDINFFIQWTRINEYREKYEYEFIWHGLMGYTRTGMRLIGPDKHNPVLMYNLGCNGVGILPSIYGGQKIANFLLGKVHKKSIFDPYI